MVAPTNNSVTSAVIGANLTGGGRGLFQVIRTGSGDIDINTGRNVQLLNQFASIYTAGTQVYDINLGGTFEQAFLNQAAGTATLGPAQQNYPVSYSVAGGNVSISAALNIERANANASRELPNNWLYRRSYVNPLTGQFDLTGFDGSIGSTTWWVDFSNFFEGVGALGGGNVSLVAGANITNVDAVIPTNARMSKGTVDNPLAVDQTLLELGGGDLVVKAGNNIDAGVYYVERGHGTLSAGGQITTNASRSPGALVTSTGANALLDSHTWLPTTLFLGKGGFDVTARGDVLLGPVANVFLLPAGLGNTSWLKTYFSTYSPDSYVNVSSIGGALTLREGAYVGGSVIPLLQAWSQTQQLRGTSATSSSGFSQPWLRLAETRVDAFSTVASLMPPVMRATAFSGDINLAGNVTLAPSFTGTLELISHGAINGLQPTGQTLISGQGLTTTWISSKINVSDANPASVPGITSPFAYQSIVGSTSGALASVTNANFLDSVDRLFKETGATLGTSAGLQVKLALHGPGPLHAGDDSPTRLYASEGDISGLTFFSPKAAQIFAGRDITDTAFYLQNVDESDGSIVAAGRDIIPYSSSSLLRIAATRTGNAALSGPLAGDIQINGPGSLEVLAGRNLDLGTGSNNIDGTGVGITSIGNGRNPYLPYEGASIFVGAGIGESAGVSNSLLDFDSFISEFVESPEGEALLAEVMTGAGVTGDFDSLSEEEQKRLALKVFFLVLRDAGRAQATDAANGYARGFAAIASLFPDAGEGEILTRGRDIRTRSGGDISIFAPGGGLTLSKTQLGNPLTPPGIITESGGNISIFTHGSVSLGIGRIFTLKGGNEIIWSSTGDIAAGDSSKTVQSAPPTRVLIEPISATVETDLAGLATGGGIGVLATVMGVPPGDVDLIAPTGTVDAGDAGIRATGNLTIAATAVLNASNIAVGGTSTGTPSTPVVTAPNIGGLASASSAAGAATSAATEGMKPSTPAPAPATEVASIVTVEVLGYGGGGGSDDDDEDEKRRKKAAAEAAETQDSIPTN
jgi:filamentous hemagglutinin